MGLYITITIAILHGGFAVLWRRLWMTIILIRGMFIEVLDNISGPQSLYCKRITAWQMQAELLPLFTVALPLGDTQALICRLRGIKLHLKFSDLSKEWPPLLDQLTLISTFGCVCRSKLQKQAGRSKWNIPNEVLRWFVGAARSWHVGSCALGSKRPHCRVG